MALTAQKKQAVPFVPLTEIEQDAFCQDDAELRTLRLADEFKKGVRWQRLPDYYHGLDPALIDAQIKAARARLGDKLFILGHHYQRDDVVKYADARGDSYLLSRIAAEQTDAEYIVFCGVHFMAETADILTDESQKVILPNLMAGCSMADMAPTDLAEDAWDDLSACLGEDPSELTPISYMNSTAAIKALCGRFGGLVCTSSNAHRAFEAAFEQSKRVFFLPDQHLGRNTALKLGVDERQIVVWNPFKPFGGLTPDAARDARVILWRGHCSVHTRFTVEQVEKARAERADVNVIVHPECTREVVDAADCVGSTEYILEQIEAAPDGSSWAVGTEISMVKRLARDNPTKTVACLDSRVCPCATMYRTHPAYLLWVLESLEAGVVQNRIEVAPDIRREATAALRRMLEIGARAV